MNDPLWDLAALFIESSFSEENLQRALLLYYDNNIPPCVPQKILIYQILMDILWAIWTRIKETQGDDFGNYGIMRFQRAISNLEKLEVETGNTAYHSVDNCIMGSNYVVAACKNSIIPNDDKIQYIGNYAFSGFEGELVLPDNITSIGEGSFAGCNITSLSFGKNLTSIYRDAFSSCKFLYEINYSGTSEDWAKIYTKAGPWNDSTGEFIVHCTDKDIKKSELK